MRLKNRLFLLFVIFFCGCEPTISDCLWTQPTVEEFYELVDDGTVDIILEGYPYVDGQIIGYELLNALVACGVNKCIPSREQLNRICEIYQRGKDGYKEYKLGQQS